MVTYCIVVLFLGDNRNLAATGEHPSEPSDAALTERVEYWRQACESAEAALAAANALLEEMRGHIPQDRRPGSLFRRSGAHLAGQGEHPSEPSTDTLQQQVEYWRTEALAANELLRSVPHPESSAYPAWAKKADAHLAGQGEHPSDPRRNHPARKTSLTLPAPELS
jgi:hypothetical protein